MPACDGAHGEETVEEDDLSYTTTQKDEDGQNLPFNKWTKTGVFKLFLLFDFHKDTDAPFENIFPKGH